MLKITPRQKELLQTFDAFPEEDQQQMLKDMKEKKETMDRIVARWLEAQQKVT
ncbi:TPA: Cro/Cl family transcriptional regulator [Escherichia coli]|nr:Cro/Cl family transcriptional regulator [Escherichia coli]